MNFFHSLKTALILCVVLFHFDTVDAAQEHPKLSSKSELVFVCSQSKGIYAYRMELGAAAITPLGQAAEITGASFLAVHPNHRFVYTVNAAKFADKPGGTVSSFLVDAQSGKLTLLNQQSSLGKGPAHLAVDREGKNVLVANYGSGSVAVFPIQQDGSLSSDSAFIQHQGSSLNRQRQEGPHAHFITTDLASHFAFVCDLGLDKVMVYRFDAAKGSLVPNDVPFASLNPGAGPRHLAFDKSGRYCYVINELDSTLVSFTYHAERGTLKEFQTLSTLPKNFAGKNFPAEIAVHPSGKFVYGSNRGHDSIAVFSINKKTGRLTLVEHHSTAGKIPRHFEIEPTGRYLLAANQDSNNVVIFRINPATGRLSATKTTIELDAPLCVKAISIDE